MLARDLRPNRRAERQQLVITALGLAAIAALFWRLGGLTVLPVVLGGLAVVATLGALLQRWCGRDVFLSFTLVSLAVGGLISKLVVPLIYLFGIAVPGSFLRLVGMNRMKRDLGACRRQPSMFVEAVPTSPEGFRRQS